MSDPTVDAIESQCATLIERRLPWEPLWRDCMEFAMPTRLFDPRTDQGKDKRPKVNFNNRAALDVIISSSGFQGYTANRRSQWAKLQFEDIALMKEHGVADWLEECERILYAVFNRASFYEGLGTMTPDGFVAGTATMYIEEVAEGRPAFVARHPMSVWVAENAYEEIDTVLEEMAMSAIAIQARFGSDNLSPRRKKDAEEDPYRWSSVKHLVRPYDEALYPYALRPFDKRMKYMSIWYDQDEGAILDVGGYWEFPFAIWRYAKNPGEEYGRSPTHSALGDIMVGNQMTRSRIKLGNQIADPTMLVDEALEGQDTLLPGHHIYRDKKDETIEPVQIGANYPITTDNETRQDALIDEPYNIPLHRMLQQMEKQMTAREVIERTGEKASLLGPTVSRYEREVLAASIRRTFNILKRAGKLPAPPQAVIEAGPDAILRIEYQGLLAQLQQRYYQTQGINASLAFAQGVGSVFQESLDWVDSDNLMVEGLESAACPASIIREKKTVEELRMKRLQAEQQAAAMQQQAAEQQALMSNADKLGKKPERGSPLEGMAKAQAQGIAG